MKVTQSCPTLWDPLDYTVHGILQARILKWVAFPISGDLPNPGIESRSSALKVDCLPAEPQRKPKNTGVASLSLLQGIFWPRNQTGVSCIAGGFFTSWALGDLAFLCALLIWKSMPKGPASPYQLFLFKLPMRCSNSLDYKLALESLPCWIPVDSESGAALHNWPPWHFRAGNRNRQFRWNKYRRHTLPHTSSAHLLHQLD